MATNRRNHLKNKRGEKELGKNNSRTHEHKNELRKPEESEKVKAFPSQE
jgi:hypothetical protein